MIIHLRYIVCQSTAHHPLLTTIEHNSAFLCVYQCFLRRTTTMAILIDHQKMHLNNAADHMSCLMFDGKNCIKENKLTHYFLGKFTQDYVLCIRVHTILYII